MKPAPFDYVRPDGVEAAVAVLAETGDDARLLAGGLSLVPMMNFRLVAPAVVIDVGGIGALKEITDHGAEVEVGAGVAQAAFERWPGLAGRLPLIAEALPHVGHYPTRARGTVGGSIAHADPSAELPLALALLDGAVRLRSAGGERRVAARVFFEGALETACREDEMVVATRWPGAAPGARYAFDEVALRHGDFAIASCAVLVEEDRMAVGFGGVADVPIVREWPRLAGSALDDALAALSEEIDVAADGSEGDGGAAYRRRLVRTLGRRTVERVEAGLPAAAGGAGREGPLPSAPPDDGPGRLAGPPTGPAFAAPASSRASLPAFSDPSHGQETDPRRPAGPASASDPASLPGGGPPGGGAGPPPRPGPHLRADERHRVEFVLNGEPCAGEAAPRLLLSDFLRGGFGRRGVHVGCEHGVCGACTVRLDGAPARACLVFAVQAHGRRVDTVEGLAAGAAGPEGPEGPGPGGLDGAPLSPLQEAFRRHHALQCGYCTPGILMTMTEWLERLALEGRAPDEAEVRAVLSGHLCRCTGYEPIVAAVMETAAGVARGPG